MPKSNKPKVCENPHAVKAGIIAKYGTIAEYIRRTGHKPGTVYAAIKSRRNGPKSRAIQEEALA